MNDNIKVSIIVPIYNVEKYLKKCLNSLVNQTIATNIEIICINDCSPDNCLKIIQEYQEKYGDQLIKIINHLENKGVAISRNDGLEIARGEYIGFVDPDDWVDLNFFEVLYSKGIESGADIVKGNFKKVKNGKRAIISKQNNIISKNIVLFCGIGWWSAIYKNEMIKNNSITFPNICNGEDDVFLTKTKYYTNRIEVVNDVFYYYFQHLDSLSSLYSNRMTNSSILCRQMQLDFLNSVPIDIENYIMYFDRFLEELIWYYTEVLNNKNLFGDKINISRGIIDMYGACKYKKEYLNNYNHTYLEYLAHNDLNGLNHFLLSNSYNIDFKLFGFLNVVQIKYEKNRKYIKLFNFFTIFKFKRKMNRKYYYFLGLPILLINS